MDALYGGDAQVSGYGVEFSDLVMVKIEAEHPVPGLDNLLARLEERRPSNWDVAASPKQYKEKIVVANYIWAASLGPTMVDWTLSPESLCLRITEEVEHTIEPTPTS